MYRTKGILLPYGYVCSAGYLNFEGHLICAWCAGTEILPIPIREVLQGYEGMPFYDYR